MRYRKEKGNLSKTFEAFSWNLELFLMLILDGDHTRKLKVLVPSLIDFLWIMAAITNYTVWCAVALFTLASSPLD